MVLSWLLLDNNDFDTTEAVKDLAFNTMAEISQEQNTIAF